MSNLSLVTPPNQPDADKEVGLEGIGYPLIKPGQYEARVVSYETPTRFAKKIPGNCSHMKEVKIYAHFRIDPLNNDGLGNEKIIVFMSFNAKTVKRPFGRNGKFTAVRRSNYGKSIADFLGLKSLQEQRQML